jgi:hypothetical protein
MAATAELPLAHRMRPYLLLIIALGMCLRLVYFSEEIGGSHTFRQAMVANQADSLKSKPYPGPKLGFLERYDQVYDYGLVFYDTPIYQYAAAKISDFFNIGTVKAGRVINLVVYAGMSLLWYEILMLIGLGLTASMLSVALFALSPLAIQTTFGIYPDTLATLAAYLSFYLLLRYERQGSWRYLGMALVFGVACTLIKSSIYIMFMVAYAWKLVWTSGWRVIRRIDAMLFALVIAASVAVFAMELVYFNYGVLLNLHGLLHDTANYQGALKSGWYFATKSRLDLSEWAQVGQRVTSEYMPPVFMPLALLGLWRVARQFIRKPAEPQLTLTGLVIGPFVTLLIFFNVIVVHDYYALPYLPVYCAMASIGTLYAYSFIRMPYSRYPRAYQALAVAAIFGSVWYAYSLRLLNYNGNRASLDTGKSIQELVPANGYLFYFHGADYVNPEYLYYTRRRGVLSNIDQADNDFVDKVMKEHRWDPGETYLSANAIRLQPAQQERLKARLDKYDLKEIGTSLDNGIVYKLIPKG